MGKTEVLGLTSECPLLSGEKKKTELSEKDPINRRSDDKENSSAVIIAESGMVIKQNPLHGMTEQEKADFRKKHQLHDKANPDYVIGTPPDEKVFDCYAPVSNNSENIVRQFLQSKIEKQQTHRIVLNLDTITEDEKKGIKTASNPRPSDEDIKKAINPDESGTLAEVIVVRDGKCQSIFKK